MRNLSKPFQLIFKFFVFTGASLFFSSIIEVIYSGVDDDGTIFWVAFWKLSVYIVDL